MRVKDYVDNAKSLLVSGDDRDKVRACLELRMALERHVYEKLKFHSRRHGDKLLYRNWQPNKAFKVLCQLEPDADRNYSISYAKETGEDLTKLNYKSFGQHITVPARWLQKHYNKLGSFLHLSMKTQTPSIPPREYLEEIIQKLEEVAQSNIHTNLGPTVSCNCVVCNSKIVCASGAIERLAHIVCPDEDCWATYTATHDGNEWMFELCTVHFSCPECSHKDRLATDHLEIGRGINCTACGSQWEIVGNEWKLAKRTDNSSKKRHTPR